MLKSARLSVVFASLVVLILLVQITAFAGNQSQEPSASAKNTPQTVKLSKKRRRRRLPQCPTWYLAPRLETTPVEVEVSDGQSCKHYPLL